jgi:hypothetical protein
MPHVGDIHNIGIWWEHFDGIMIAKSNLALEAL